MISASAKEHIIVREINARGEKARESEKEREI